jgi:hypothetical protein
MVAFRVQRELLARERGVGTWIPPADRLLLAASTLALLGVLLPLVVAHPGSAFYRLLPASSCAVVIVLLAAYPFALLAHYRLILGSDRTGVRGPVEPGEVLVIWCAVALSLVVFVWTMYLRTR